MRGRACLDLRPGRKGGLAINNLFDSEAPVWALFGKLADIAVISILWVICSLPVITLGASFAAMMRCVMNMQTGLGNWRGRHFLRYFRQNLRNATPIWLIYLAAAAILVFDLLVLSGSAGLYSRILKITSVIGLILWLMTAVWAFTLTSHFENSLGQTIRNAFILSVSYLPRSILMCIMWVLPVGLAVFVPNIFTRIMVLWPALFFGGTAYLCARLMEKPVIPYLGLEAAEDSDME